MAGAQQHRVPLADVHPLLLQRPLQVLDRDDRADRHPPDAAKAGHVDQHAAGEEDAGVLDAELLQAVGLAEFRALEAVVEVIVAEHAHADVICKRQTEGSPIGPDDCFLGCAVVSSWPVGPGPGRRQM